jgi:hypothetical protein
LTKNGKIIIEISIAEESDGDIKLEDEPEVEDE